METKFQCDELEKEEWNRKRKRRYIQWESKGKERDNEIERKGERGKKDKNDRGRENHNIYYMKILQ